MFNTSEAWGEVSATERQAKASAAEVLATHVESDKHVMIGEPQYPEVRQVGDGFQAMATVRTRRAMKR